MAGTAVTRRSRLSPGARPGRGPHMAQAASNAVLILMPRRLTSRVLAGSVGVMGTVHSPGARVAIASAWIRSASRSASAWFTSRCRATRDRPAKAALSTTTRK